MGSKKASRTLDDRVTDLENKVESVEGLARQALAAHQDKINELEIKQISQLRRALALLTARVDQLEKQLPAR